MPITLFFALNIGTICLHLNVIAFNGAQIQSTNIIAYFCVNQEYLEFKLVVSAQHLISRYKGFPFVRVTVISFYLVINRTSFYSVFSFGCSSVLNSYMH